LRGLLLREGRERKEGRGEMKRKGRGEEAVASLARHTFAHWPWALAVEFAARCRRVLQ